MTDTDDQAARDWNQYWTGSQDNLAFASEGVNHPAVDAYWKEFFETSMASTSEPRIVDIACGKGALTEAAIAAFGKGGRYECLDSSERAISAVTERFPSATGHVADAADPGLEHGAYDIVVSQFGVEYAGLDATAGLADLLAPGGTMSLMLHSKDGLIYSECSDNLSAVKALHNSAYLDHVRMMFTTGFAALKGKASKEDYTEAVRAVLPPMRAVEDILDSFGQNAAGGTVSQLYTEVANIQESLANFDEDEVADWLQNMETELQGYAGRMQSMCDASIDADQFKALVTGIGERGMEIVQASPLAAGQQQIAWILTAKQAT